MKDNNELMDRCGCGKGLSEEYMSKMGIYTFSYFVLENRIICSDYLVKKYGVLPMYEGNPRVFVEDFLDVENHNVAFDFIRKVKDGSDQKALFMTRVEGDMVCIALFIKEKTSTGQVSLVEGIVECVTDSILMEKKKRIEVLNTNKMLSAAIRSVYPNGVLLNISKDTYRMIFFDDSFPNESGKGIDTYATMVSQALGDDEERDHFIEVFSRAALMRAYAAGKKEIRLEHSQYLRDGDLHWVESRFIFVTNENADVCAIVLNSLIDEKKKQEDEIKGQLEIVEALSRDYLNVFMIDLKKDRLKVVKAVGRGSSDEYEKSDKEYVYSKSAEKFVRLNVHPDDIEDVLQRVSVDFIKRTFRRSEEYVSSCKVTEKGKVHYYQYKFVKLKKPGSQIAILGFQNIDNIVTKEKKMNEELRKAIKEANAANEAKSNFFFNMSHDIRTPMNAILGSANLLKNAEGDIEKQRKYIDNISVSGKYLLELINGVLEMSRIESDNFNFDIQCMNLNELADSIATIFEDEYRKKKQNIERSIYYEHPYVLADFTRCQEIILNIMSNAVKYTPEGGTIRITSKELSSANGYGYYETTIEDTGIGISPEYLPHIFERFSRERSYTENKVVGTGLGMGITKKLVEGMGGTINVESQLGKGTKVTFTIPFEIAEDAEIATKSIDLSLEFTGESKRVLLAEDNELNSDIAIALLESRGFEVELAKDGVECFEMFDGKADDYYDLILMDIQMPRMDGFQTTKRIRNLGDMKKATIPIIAMTANVFDEDRKRAFDAGMDGFTGKPIDVSLFFGEIGRLLKKE